MWGYSQPHLELTMNLSSKWEAISLFHLMGKRHFLLGWAVPKSAEKVLAWKIWPWPQEVCLGFRE